MKRNPFDIITILALMTFALAPGCAETDNGQTPLFGTVEPGCVPQYADHVDTEEDCVLEDDQVLMFCAQPRSISQETTVCLLSEERELVYVMNGSTGLGVDELQEAGFQFCHTSQMVSPGIEFRTCPR